MTMREISSRLSPADLDRLRHDLAATVDRRRGAAPGAADDRREVLVCAGGACMSCRAGSIIDQLGDRLEAAGLRDRVRVVPVGCMGLCDAGPLLLVSPDGVYYPKVDEESLGRIVAEHLLGGEPVRELELTWEGEDGEVRRSGDVPFFAQQIKIALRNCGRIEPDSLAEYVAAGGFRALETVLAERDPDGVLRALKRSGLRGRGGAGFPAGLKWQLVRDADGDTKYVVCNADEGDPGAFMDRSLLEGDPLSVIEGMTIAGFVVGAQRGYVYVRAEYPLAIERLDSALTAARTAGLLGDDILGSGFAFDIEIRIGAGAFVCGEETALIRSIEGKRGMPRPRPPFPAESGVHGQPTLLSNVETWANVPEIIHRGAEWYAGIGTQRSKGTKVFALAGAVCNTGLVEVPMGVTLREVVDHIGGGIRSGLPFKAAQSGGPSGGCIPAEHADVAVDYESLQELGAIMGSGGLIIMDEGTCMVELARFFMDFIVDESCGKCPPCRIGNRVMLNILEKITAGEGTLEDLDTLEEVAAHIQSTSLCGLGQTGPNPVLSTMRHFRAEYEEHVRERRCRAAQCKSMLAFTIEEELCNGCGLCAKACPTSAISGEIKHIHVIDQEDCIHCGACLTECPSDAVVTRWWEREPVRALEGGS